MGQTATASLAGLDSSGCNLHNGYVENDDNAKLASAISSCGEVGYGPGYAIVLDGNGAVVDVRGPADGGTNSQVLDCILAVLGGLTFPCLADTKLCPEEICLE